MATEGQRKEIFDKLKIVVTSIINDNLFAAGITGEEFYNKFISLFDSWKSPVIKSGLKSKKNDIIQLFNIIYENNTDEILQLAHAGGKDIKKRTIGVMDFVIDKVEEITGYQVMTDWQTYKTANPSGGRRRRFRTKKRKTKKYKRMSKRNRKF
jgi:hypothetical protein